MRRFIITLAAILFSTVAAIADDNKVYSLDISYLLHKDGSASVTEVWDIDVAEGTEWYLVRNNLRDIRILDFTVHDENETPYISDNPWDIDRDLDEKAGMCGINETSEGMELCWGLGSYDRHTYTVSYRLSNAVQSLKDYDMFHFQTVNRKLTTPPEKVITTVEVADYQMDTTNVRLWGFGYEGSARIVGGKAYFASSEPFETESSMICLLRFEKGFFESASILDKPFEEHLEVAMEGSDYYEDDVNPWAIAGGTAGALLLVIFGIAAIVRASRKAVLGMNYDDVEESGEIPFGGNLYVASKVLDELMESRRGSSVAAALIVRMIYKGVLKVRKLDDENVEICFNPDFSGELEGPAKVLYNMMKDASGIDGVLQAEEFENWSKGNEKRIVKWEKSIDRVARKFIADKGYKLDGRYNAEFQREARKLLGLKKYLKKYSEMRHVGLEESELFREYLVYAALFEISDDVAEQLNSVNPAAFRAVGTYDYNTWRILMHNNVQLSRSITNTVALSGSSGAGGASSFGGGAGFSGGGCGGGAR